MSAAEGILVELSEEDFNQFVETGHLTAPIANGDGRVVVIQYIEPDDTPDDDMKGVA